MSTTLRARFASAFVLCAGLVGSPADAVQPEDRRSILDAIRPVAAGRVARPVKIKVDILNVDSGWAVLVGELVSSSGAPLDWSSSECHPDLDKMLWVVLKKSAGTWKVRDMDVCASEPPYWYLDSSHGGLVWPCGVYAGLDAGGEDGPLEQQCRRQIKSKSVKK